MAEMALYNPGVQEEIGNQADNLNYVDITSDKEVHFGKQETYNLDENKALNKKIAATDRITYVLEMKHIMQS